jgi:hypothetical protein
MNTVTFIGGSSRDPVVRKATAEIILQNQYLISPTKRYKK